MIGKREGFVALIRRELLNPDTLMFFHRILHKEKLCAKSAFLNDTLNGVIGIVNYIRANATRHRQFRQMLQYDDEIFSVDLSYHSKVIGGSRIFLGGGRFRDKFIRMCIDCRAVNSQLLT